jgi:DNA-binding LytR/AlgR family response regulator
MKMKAIIIDDDAFSRELISELVKKNDMLQLVKSFENPIDSIPYLKSNQVDLIFLDIQMPEMNGIEFVSLLNQASPQVIMTTSSRDFAVEAFQHNVSGYLIKPIELIAFIKAVNKAYDNFNKSSLTKMDNKTVFVKEGRAINKINIEDIPYVESLGDYAILFTASQKFTVHTTMKALEENLINNNFIRVHRSFLVNLIKIDKLEDDCIVIQKKPIPVGKTYKQDVINSLNLL